MCIFTHHITAKRNSQIFCVDNHRTSSSNIGYVWLTLEVNLKVTTSDQRIRMSFIFKGSISW